MNFEIKTRKRHFTYHYHDVDYKLAEDLSSKLKKELGELLKAVVFFGSAARGKATPGSDLDILLILNDIKFVFSDEVIASVRVIIENTALTVSEKFHITTMQLGQFWDYVRQGDPIIVNMLRDGVSIYDEGFFEPAQVLLETGKIRPTKEAVWSYYQRAPRTLKEADKKMLSLIVDMYWAVIDSAHAALMHIDILPPAPQHVAELLDENFVTTGLLEKKYLNILRKFYMLAKEIGHEKMLEVDGKKIDTYMLEAHDFVKRMRFILHQDAKKLKHHVKK